MSGAAEGADAKADKESRAPASAGALLRASPLRHAAREGERRAPLCAGAPRRGEKREGGGRAVRRRAALCRGGACTIAQTEESVTVPLSPDEQFFRSLWQEYYRSVDISLRPHERQMKNYMPVHYWKFLPEKNI